MGGELVRVVESQEQVATAALVDNLSEQAMLEELLELSKPPPRTGTEGLHYLLASPFRYPPLRHGSRFGSRLEPSLFYGAKSVATALAESAYYRLVFWNGMKRPPPGGRLLTQHTAFRARFHTDRGLRLQEPPCAAQQHILTDPGEYVATQAFGKRLRNLGTQAIEYTSARDPMKGLNVALFAPQTLTSRRPIRPEPWLCETRAEWVIYSAPHQRGIHRFLATTFQVDGQLPRPSS